MNLPTVLLGIAITMFGVSTIILRHTHPQWFAKLGPMKEKLGQRIGYIVHFLGYSAMPLGFGIMMIIHGLNGGSIFDY